MCARFRWYWALNTMPRSLSFIWQAKGSPLKAISWFRNSMEEGKLTMGKKVRAEKEGICGGLQHEVQRLSTRTVAVRRERSGYTDSLVLGKRGASS